MSELHVLMPDGQQSVCTEDQVNELLEQGVITLETYYWQEGMEDWRPLLELATPDTSSTIPPETFPEPLFPAPSETSFAIPSEAPTKTLPESRPSIPSFVPPRRASSPDLPSPQRAVVSPTRSSDAPSAESLPKENSEPTGVVAQPQAIDAKPAVSRATKEVKPAPAVEQLEFDDAKPIVLPLEKESEPAAPVTPPQPIAAEPAIRFEKIEATPGPVDPSPKRYEFRKSPLVLTLSLQILLVLSLLTTLFYLYQCYEQVYGIDDSTALLMGAASPNGAVSGVSDSDTSYFLDFIWILVGAQVLIESLFFCWVYLANFNCRGFAPNMIFTPGWAVGYFFIPLLNFFRPYQVVQEIWKVSENPEGWLGKRGSVFVGFWFLCRLAILAIPIISLGSFPASYSASPDPHVRMLGTLCYLMVVESIVFFIEATTLILVSVVTSRQVKLTRQ